MKNKVSIFLSLLLIVVIAIGTAACSADKKDDNKNTTTTASTEETITNDDSTNNSDVNTPSGETSTPQDATIAVTDKNGNAVTNKNGEAVTEKAPAKATTKKASKTTKKQTTTESTTHFTTTKPAGQDAVMGVEMPLDDYALTENSALYYLGVYYGDKYVVNFDMPNCKGDDYSYAVFSVKDPYTIVKIAKLNLYTGKGYEIDQKTGKKKALDFSD